MAATVAMAAIVAMPTLAAAQQTLGEPEAPVVPTVRSPAAPPVIVVEPPVVDPPGAPVAPQAAPAAPSITAPLKGVVKELRSGPLLIHGNYCGIGNRPGKPPIDALDAACMRHDACTRTGKLPSCACDDRLRAEATSIAQDPRTPADIQVIASATAASMAILICKVTPRS